MNKQILNERAGDDLRWLVLDLNSYFASCEQQERPALRGKPIAIVPMMAETTCAIAASYAAKACGIKTGTLVRDARSLCPSVVFVEARPKVYVTYHKRILDVIEKFIPIEDVMSIDEVACRLDKRQTNPTVARALAQNIKRAIQEEVGECLTSSVGIASNRLLAKLASDMQKPDGLVLLTKNDLPERLLPLGLQDICGIGVNMAARLHSFGIDTVAQLWEADAFSLRRAWGGINGARFHALLHGADLASPVHPRRSLGHQHVLAPEERSHETAEQVLHQLLFRAAERLRREGFYCTRLIIDLKGLGGMGGWGDERRFAETRDTRFLNRIFADIWKKAPRWKLLRVGVTLGDLVPEDRHQPDLFEEKKPKPLMEAMDLLNQKFGKGTLFFADQTERLCAMPTKISFHRVPDEREY